MNQPAVFTDVPSGLAKPLIAKGFTELTEIQKAVLAPALAGQDLCISSQTGSGKTVALGFMVAADVATPGAPRRRGKAAQPAVLIIAPTRELASQIGTELSWLFAEVGARIAVLTGGTHYGRDFQALAQAPDILIGTPGRLLDHVRRGSVSLAQLQSLVLDEADQMLDMGFRDELEAILDQTPTERRTHLVSATLPREVLSLARRYQRDAVQVRGTPRGAANTDIAHIGHIVRPEDKVSALINLLLAAAGERVLVFARTRLGTSELALELAAHGFSAAGLSGDMGQQERTATLDAFRGGAVRILVATDVAARGLDISDVSRVIHFDIPENDEAFTHRSGRTGRAGNKGTSVLLVPAKAQRRVMQLLRRAGVSVAWKPLPSADEIRRRADARLLAEVASGAGTAGARHDELARQLLAQGDAVDVVAALLARNSHLGPCEPREVEAISNAPAGGAEHGKKKPRAGRSATTHFVPFHISWGEKHGANPSRLLALVCRRGQVAGRAVGSIRIGEFRSTFEVAAEVADDFARAAARTDARDPRVKIRRWTDAVPGTQKTKKKDLRHKRGPRTTRQLSGTRPPASRT